MEAERQHKNLLIPVLNFNHWNPAKFSAQPAEPHGNHPGPKDSVIVTSLPAVCSIPAGPTESLSQKKLHNAIYTSLNARDPAACVAIQPFFCSCGGECQPHHDGTACDSLCLPVPAGRDSPFPHRDVTRVSVNQDVTADTLQTCEQTSPSRAVQRGVGSSCHSLLFLHCGRLTHGA